ncbi:Verru_Chthon cassette protein B [Prosthecobacter sp.]|uniref:Verru_Chthon cassette protein B n=1 Tax=Prosthecobacter sp. TaxID=1965333 RepID=UPI003782FC8D
MNTPAFTSPSSMKRSSLRRVSSAGFSLVEVALAVAIAALAIITLLGLLPQGLEMSRKTALLNTNSSILEQIIRNLENMKWSDIPTSGVTTKYYSDQGLEVTSDSKEISFVAEIDYSKQATLPQSETLEPYLNRVIIRVATSSSPTFKFGTDNRMSYSVFNHLIAKSR